MPDFAARRRSYLFMLKKLKMPRPLATSIVKSSVRAISPAAQRKRRIAELPLAKALPITDPQGYRIYGPGELPGAAQAVQALRGMFADEKTNGPLAELAKSKPFLISVAPDQRTILANEAVRDFVLSDEVVDTVTRYLGEVPILTEILLLWTPPNETVQKSQMYHYDGEDLRQIKLFLNVFDVDDDCGPFTLLPADLSGEVSAQSGYKGGKGPRLDDEAVNKAAAGKEVQVKGDAGSGIFVDTSRCLHFGSRGNRKERLVLMVQFASVNAPQIDPTDWTPLAATLGPLDPVRRMMLNAMSA